MKIKIILLFMFLWFSSEKAASEDPDPNSPLNFKHYIVSFLPNADKSIVAKYGTIERELPTINIVLANLTEEQAQALSQEPGVKSVEEDQIIQIGPATSTSNTGIKALNNQMQTMEYILGSQWNLDENGIKAEQAWQNFNVNGQGVKIAIIDSGVDYNLTDLQAPKYLGGYDFCVTWTGSTCSGTDEDPADEHGHGTEITSVILGTGNTISKRRFTKRPILRPKNN